MGYPVFCFGHSLMSFVTVLLSFSINVYQSVSFQIFEKWQNEYRPISLLNVIGKIFEKIFLKQYLLNSIKIPWQPHQYAFIPNRPTGTSLALTSIRIWCLNAIDKLRGTVRLIAIDFRKAFDKVDHAVLLNVALNRFKIDHALIKMLSSYLSNRKQKVINASLFLQVSSGIPQGSILGPVLFCMVIGQLPTQIVEFQNCYLRWWRHDIASC